MTEIAIGQWSQPNPVAGRGALTSWRRRAVALLRLQRLRRRRAHLRDALDVADARARRDVGMDDRRGRSNWLEALIGAGGYRW